MAADKIRTLLLLSRSAVVELGFLSGVTFRPVLDGTRQLRDCGARINDHLLHQRTCLLFFPSIEMFFRRFLWPRAMFCGHWLYFRESTCT